MLGAGTNIDPFDCLEFEPEIVPCVRPLCRRPRHRRVFAPALAFAGDIEWRRYVIPSTGTSVDMPVSIFTSDAGAPEGGTGRRFFTEDRRADLTVQSVRQSRRTIRPPRSWPRSGRLPASSTSGSRPDFFVVSSIRNDRIWYNRCNRGNGTMNCVMINYPAAEKRQWDAVVTRISRTLRG